MASRQNNNVVPTRSSARISNAKAAAATAAAAAAAAAPKPAQSPKAQRQARRRRDARKARARTAPGKEIRPSVKAVPKSAPATNKRKRDDNEDDDEKTKGGDVPSNKKSRGQGKTAITRKTTSVAKATATTTLGGQAPTRAAAEPALRRVVLNVKKPALEIRLNVSPPLPAEHVSKRRKGKAAGARRPSVKKTAVALTPLDLRRHSDDQVAAQKNSRAERLKSLRAKRAARASTAQVGWPGIKSINVTAACAGLAAS